jgi:hypothetical protein
VKATPEGRVKTKVKRIIAEYAPYVYSHWPVLNGMGKPTLDCVGCIAGRFFAVETKAPGEKITMRQAITMREMQAAGAVVFVLDGDEFTLAHFDAWLHMGADVAVLDQLLGK